MPHDPDQATATRRRMLVGGATGVATALGSLALVPRTALAQSSPTTTAGGQGGSAPTSASGGGASTTAPTGTTTSTLPAQVAESPADLPHVLFARAVAFAGVQVYGAVIDKGSVAEPTAAAAVAAFQTQHREAGTTWSGLAGIPSGDEAPNPDLIAAFLDRAGRASSQDQALEVLHDTEEVVAATMLSVLGDLQATEGAELAAGLLSSAARRSAVLAALQDAAVGDTPITDITPAAQTTAGALQPSTGA